MHFYKNYYFCNTNAEIAQLVEHDLAKVGVASSSLVFRSNILSGWRGFFLTFLQFICPGGGTGRHAGLKILWTVNVRAGSIPASGTFSQKVIRFFTAKPGVLNFIETYCNLFCYNKKSHKVIICFIFS